MHSLARPLAAGAFALAALLATPADAACVGEQSIAYVCVTPPIVVLGEHEYCVYAGDDTCRPVSVPTVGTSGQLEVECHGMLGCPASLMVICQIQNLVECPISIGR